MAIVSFLVLKMLMLVSICESAFGNMGWGSKDGSNLPWYKGSYEDNDRKSISVI